MKRWRSVRGTGSAARVTATVLCWGWVLATMYGGRETGYNWSNPATWAICFGPLAIWARSAFFGIYVMSND